MNWSESNAQVGCVQDHAARGDGQWSVGDWAHVTSQIGMFAYTGLNKAQVICICCGEEGDGLAMQVQRLVKEFHIYMTANGRISMAGLSTTTVPYFAECVKVVCSEGVKGATV